MATDVMPNTEPSMTKLIGGIIDDTQRLVLQQAELLKADLRKDFQEAKEVGQSLMIAGSLLGVGGLLLSFALVYLIKWAVPALHESACFGIVGGLIALAGGIVYYQGREKLDKLNPVPEQSAQALKENLQWKTNPN
jgi:hypothetical protein